MWIRLGNGGKSAFGIMGLAGVFPHDIPKCCQNGTWLARTFLFQHACMARRANKSTFSHGGNLCGFGLLRNGGKSVFEIMGQAGVFPAIYPNSAKMAFGWPTGQN